MMLSPGYIAQEAAAIEVPVLIAAGERDVGARPARRTRRFQALEGRVGLRGSRNGADAQLRHDPQTAVGSNRRLVSDGQ